MAESELQRLERQMAELREKHKAAAKREREKLRRQENRRRTLIGTIIADYGDDTLIAMVNKLLIEHVPIGDRSLWPHLWPEIFGVEEDKTTSDSVHDAPANDNQPLAEPERYASHSG